MYEEYLTKALSNIIMAGQALTSFEAVGVKDFKNGASYHAQQAIEIIIRYCIYNELDDLNHSQIRVHDLDKLIKTYCKPLGIKVPSTIEKNAKMYSAWEAESRYSLSYTVRVDSINLALNEAEKWLLELKPAYKKKLESVKQRLSNESS